MRAILRRLERANELDRISERAQGVVTSTLRARRIRDFLHGVWLGHPLHPVLVQMPIGAWSSVAVLDLMRGHRRPATVLVAVGTASALPAAVAGWNDWAEQAPEQRRVGLVHATVNLTALGLYTGSLVARLQGRHAVGRTLAYLGMAMATGGAYLGGHLTYKQGAAVNHGVPELRRIEDGWHPIGEVASLPEGTLVTRQVDDVGVIVYRDGDETTVMLERCAHQSGPLGEGEVIQVDGRACVVCPWHDSAFSLHDGEVVHGPAGTDQQVLPTRVVDGMLQTRLP